MIQPNTVPVSAPMAYESSRVRPTDRRNCNILVRRLLPRNEILTFQDGGGKLQHVHFRSFQILLSIFFWWFLVVFIMSLWSYCWFYKLNTKSFPLLVFVKWSYNRYVVLTSYFYGKCYLAGIFSSSKFVKDNRDFALFSLFTDLIENFLRI